MIDYLKLFLQPYLQFLLGAAYNVQQTLEGLHIWTAGFAVRDKADRIVGGYWSATEAVAVPFGMLLLYAIALAPALVLAVRFAFGRRAMWMLWLAAITPGVLALMGAYPTIRWTPASYIVGSGDLGEPMGMLAVLLLGLMSGWVIVVAATGFLRLGDRFRHSYDHVWYAIGVVAGCLFVMDLNSARDVASLREANQVSKGESAYLLAQVRRFAAVCDRDASRYPHACPWAAGVQGRLSEYAHEGDHFFFEFGPANSAEVYAADVRRDAADAPAVRKELVAYNDLECPVTSLGGGFSQSSPVSARCEAPPEEYCAAFPETLGSDDMRSFVLRPVAIANECIVPTLIQQRRVQSGLRGQVDTATSGRHIRWMFFIFLSVLAGGKVANASMRLREAAEKSRKERQGVAAAGIGSAPSADADADADADATLEPSTGP